MKKLNGSLGKVKGTQGNSKELKVNSRDLKGNLWETSYHHKTRLEAIHEVINGSFGGGRHPLLIDVICEGSSMEVEGKSKELKETRGELKEN